MKLLENMLAILGICVALLGPLAATGEEATASLDARASDAWIDDPGSDRAELPEPLWLESAPLRAESELDENLDQDPAAPTALEDGQAVVPKTSSWEPGTSSQDVELGAHSARGPPAA